MMTCDPSGRLLCFGLAAAGLSLSACTDRNEADDPSGDVVATQTAIPVEPDGGIGDGASPLPETTDTANFARTMPASMIGDWHRDILGRAPGAKDCDPRLRGGVDYDRLITVRENGYSYFETGGRIMTVHNRSDSMIDATFDTTYADEPTSERRDFALQPDGSLAINLDDGDGVMKVVQYRRCPEVER